MENENLDTGGGGTVSQKVFPIDKDFDEKSLEESTRLDLIQMLKKYRVRCCEVEEANQKLHDSVTELEKALDDQSRKCQLLEEDKSFLRNNIKKATDNWFERKAKLSVGEQDSAAVENEIEDQSVETSDSKLKKDRAQIWITDEAIKLFSELKFKDEQLDLSERRCAELNKRLKDYEKVIDDHEIIIHGLEKQLDTYFNDNQKMSKQLADLHKLFIDLEAINEKQVNIAVPSQENDSSTDYLPTSEEFKEMSGSVTKTYMKLKELIYEKKSLVTEIERLRTLNVELQNRVSQQETRLISVSDALQTTWLLVSNLKDEHAKIHTSETILRYELKEKREILHRLREELECSREQWHIIRQKNSETEQEWTNLRDELNERRRLKKFAEINGNSSLTSEELEGAASNVKATETKFEPPIDLLVDMGIEYGVVEADDEESTTAVALIDGEDVHENRLLNLEEQCCFLYQKLMGSTARALTLASRLSSLHQHYAMSNDDDEDDDENEQYMDEDEENYEHEYDDDGPVSPDSESYDTAYVSEPDGADSGSGVVDTMDPTGGASVETDLTEIPSEVPSELLDENCDLLSRRLITFLPRKIEILRAENKKMEEKLHAQQEEKTKTESRLTTAVDSERRQRKLLEEQLCHLGKCVDELKLERNGKIAEVEEELRKKVEEVKVEEREHIIFKEKYESLKEKYDERGELLQLTASQLEQTVKDSEEKLSELQKEVSNLKNEIMLEKQVPVSCLRPTILGASRPCPASHNSNIRSDADEEAGRNWLERWRWEEAPSLRMVTEVFKQPQTVVILKNTCMRIPIRLSLNLRLFWDLKISPKGIKFGILFDEVSDARDMNDRNRTLTASHDYQEKVPNSTDSHKTIPEFHDSLRHILHITKELLLPMLIPSSSSSFSGNVTPKIPGLYHLVFQNHSPETQEIKLKLWVDND